MAFSGHSSTQVPQSTQVSASILAFSFTVIASTGHTSAQFPHPVHFSSSTFAAIDSILFFNTLASHASPRARAFPVFYQTPSLVVFIMNYICTICRKRATAVAGWCRHFQDLAFETYSIIFHRVILIVPSRSFSALSIKIFM
jgi:hypothetical protein